MAPKKPGLRVVSVATPVFDEPKPSSVWRAPSRHFVLAAFALTACCVAISAASRRVAAEDTTPKSLVHVDHRKQLFVDDRLIAATSNLTRELGHVTKANNGKPLLVADKPWEQASLLRLGSVFRDGDRFRMWYGMNTHFLGYAESKDGLRWTKPNLGLHKFQDSKDNNILHTEAPMGVTCFLDPHETDPAHKYKSAYCPTKPPYGACLAHSPDGLHWTPYNNGRPVTHRAADTINCLLWDEDALAYRLYTRTDFGPGFGGRPENRGTRDMINPDVKADPTAWKIVRDWGFDPEGRGEYKRRQAHHLVGWMYQGIHFGLLCSYEWLGRYKHPGPEVMNFYLLTARDDAMWDLSWVYAQKPLIARGEEGSFDTVWVQVGKSVVTTKDSHWIYYVGSKDRRDGSREYAIGAATLRLDGFVCLEAKDKPGTVTTNPFKLHGGKLEINVDAKNGQVELEVLDANGAPIPGFSRDEATSRKGVDELQLKPTWRAHADVAVLKGKTVRLKFHLKKAKLYAFQVMP